MKISETKTIKHSNYCHLLPSMFSTTKHCANLYFSRNTPWIRYRTIHGRSTWIWFGFGILQNSQFPFMVCVALKLKLIQYWMLPSIGIKHSPKLFGLLKVGKHFRMLPCPALHPLKALWDWWRIGCFVVKVGWIRSCLLYDSLFNLSFLYFFAFTFSLIFSLKLNTWVLFGKRE